MKESKDQNLDLKKECYAKWRNSNDQKYLEVYAPDSYTLGLLQGEYLSKQIHHLKKLIVILSLRYIHKKYTYHKFKKIARNYEEFIPKKFKLEMKGMADAIKEINYNDILLQNCFFDLLYGHLLPKDTLNRVLNSFNLGCTSFGVINSDKPLTGQNFDYPKIFKSALSFVHLKTPNLKELFSLRLGSILSIPAGINNHGLCLRINAIKSSVNGFITIPGSIRTRLVLEELKNSEDAFNFLIRIKNSPASCNLLISDCSKIIAMEIIPDNYMRKDVQDLIVRSNTFTSDSFQKYLIKARYSKKRQKYAENLLMKVYEENNNSLSDENLLTILADEPIICRCKRMRAATLAYITNKYFGLGNAKQNKPGQIPLNF